MSASEDGRNSGGHPENVSDRIRRRPPDRSPHTGMGTRVRGSDGTSPPSQLASQRPAATRTRVTPASQPDWRAMTRQDFNTDSPAPELFDLEPGCVTADDGHGTGDLLELLEPSEVMPAE